MAEWDAGTYHRVSAPHQVWGPEVMDRLDLSGDETVLDAGCGSGRVTRLLAERLPRGRVVAVDSSAAMVAEARENLADLGDRVVVLHQDLLELELGAPVDAIFSSAVLHWVTDHDRLFARLRAALRPAGRLAVQCGGKGNVAGVIAAFRAVERTPPFAAHVGAPRTTWFFAGPEETAERLERVGFREVRAWLTPHDAWVPAGEEARSYMATIMLRDQLELLPPELHDSFVAGVEERLERREGCVRLDYVRLNVDALG
jgi:trans-aconitate 2-methyltransferase